MLEVVINWVYYDWQDWWRFNFNKWRWKKSSVYFYDYSDEIWYIINHLNYSELEKLRLSIYNYLHDWVKFERFWEENINWELFTGYKISTWVFSIDDSDFACMLPKIIRRKYFKWDNIKEKYILDWDFINYIRLEWVSM